MKKYIVFALALALSLALSACGRRDADTTRDTSGTTGMTMPTIITTTPSTQEHIPGTTFHPDDDGMIGDTHSTEDSIGDAGMHPG